MDLHLKHLGLLLFIFMLSVPYSATSQVQTDSTVIHGGWSTLEHIDPKYQKLYSSHSKIELKKFINSLNVEKISLRKTGDFCCWPEYKITYAKDGSAIHIDKMNSPEEEKRNGSISLWDFGRLCYLIDYINFEELENNYSQLVTDSQEVVITVEYSDGTIKRVEDYANTAPIEFWALEMAIDNISSQIEWGKN